MMAPRRSLVTIAVTGVATLNFAELAASTRAVPTSCVSGS